MSGSPVKWCFNLLILVVLTLLPCTVSAETGETERGWPRLYGSDGNQVVVHQPQLEKWDDFLVLRGKAAVVVQLKNDKKKYYGALDFQASTAVDNEARTVFLHDFKITGQTYPNIDPKLAGNCRKAVEKALPAKGRLTISLDRVVAALERSRQQTREIEVNLEPPPIHYSNKPAVLVNFMGEPKFETVKGVSGLLFAVNTNWDVFLEVGSSRYYMLNGDGWLVTEDLAKGPWKPAGKLPKSFKKLPDNENWQEVKKNIPGKKVKKVPKIYVSMKPAELIVTDGAPEYTPISATKLLFVANTESDIFLYSPTSTHYFLVSGRWFKAKKLGGKWSAASKDLPEDFSLIQSDHQKGHVLSSVPGTPEADAAVLLASVPKKATVSRKTTKVKVVYEGEPEFDVIKGTSSPVYFAVNTPYNVFRVDKMYYCVHNGVWFQSSSPKGPWVVSTVVPAVIYTIPADHPKHNVTYVYIYDSTPDVVVVGYTSGYSGTYVATTGVVVYGVGYWVVYDDWYQYHHYYYHPYYYSYGCAYHYDYYYGSYYRSASYYGPYGGAGGWRGYDPASGTYYRGGYAYGPYGSAFARQAYNPYTGRSAAQVGAKTPYGSWGRSVYTQGNEWARGGYRSSGDKVVGGIETSKGGKMIGGYNRETGQGGFIGKDKGGDLYVGKDGEIYKREDGSWKKNVGDGWEPVDKGKAREQAKSRAAESDRQRRGSAERSSSLEVRQSDRQRRGSADRPSSSQGRQGSQQRRSSTGRSSSRQGNLNREYQRRSTGNTRANNYRRSYSGGQRSSGSRQRSFGGASRSRGSFGGGRGGGRGGGGGRRR